MSRAEVRSESLGVGASWLSVETDAEGRFVLSRLCEGMHTVEAWTQNGGGVTEPWRIVRGVTVRDVVIRVGSTATVSGTIDFSGLGFELGRATLTEIRFRTSTREEYGELGLPNTFTVERLLPGSYHVVLQFRDAGVEDGTLEVVNPKVIEVGTEDLKHLAVRFEASALAGLREEASRHGHATVADYLKRFGLRFKNK